MQITIEKMDHSGRGIGYIDRKIVFVSKSFIGDIVDIEITKVKKNYLEGKIVNIIQPSDKRIKHKCPYFPECGGCDLQEISYEDTIEYKKNKIVNIFKKINIDIKPEIIVNANKYNYRNKIEVKIVNGKIGYYQNDTHKLVEINNCLIAMECINDTLKLIPCFNISKGNITIRCNSNNEILLVIDTKEDIKIDIDYLKNNIKLVGVVLNNKTVYGNNFLIERINKLFFKISYDSFFQVNHYITSKLFELIKDNIDIDSKVLDLYCGVGTLSIVSASKAREVTGIEIVPNAVINAIDNAKINKINNVNFVLNDVAKVIDKITLDYDTIIVDPPRKGLDKNTINVINKMLPEKIIYVSCNPQTLVRDLDILLNNYKLKDIKLLDMFSYTNHIETFCLLKRKKL